MSKELDYNNLSEDDKEWLRARGWGNRIPGEQKSDPTGGTVLTNDMSGEELISRVPNTGTATRPVDHGVEVNPVGGDDGDDGDDGGYTADDYKSWKVPDLKAEISDRNESRDDEAKITPESDKKDHLVAALVADDEANAE